MKGNNEMKKNRDGEILDLKVTVEKSSARIMVLSSKIICSKNFGNSKPIKFGLIPMKGA